jgi:hypothetical protein
VRMRGGLNWLRLAALQFRTVGLCCHWVDEVGNSDFVYLCPCCGEQVLNCAVRDKSSAQALFRAVIYISNTPWRDFLFWKSLCPCQGVLSEGRRANG